MISERSTQNYNLREVGEGIRKDVQADCSTELELDDRKKCNQLASEMSQYESLNY